MKQKLEAALLIIMFALWTCAVVWLIKGCMDDREVTNVMRYK